MDWLPLIPWLFTTAAIPLAMATANTCASCCGSPCGACTNGTMSATVQVDVAGVTNGSCTDCNDLNATYILPVSVSGGSPCIWTFVFPAAICGASEFTACTLNVNTAGAGGLGFGLVRVGTDLSWATTTAPGRRDCDTWNLFSLPPTITTTVCDNTAATCFVTKI